MLTARELTVGYQGSTRTVLNRLNVSFAPAQFTAILGPNGSGKSTLIKSLLRIVRWSNGSVDLDGTSVADFSRKELARRVAYLPQDSQCADYMTVAELADLGRYAQTGPLARFGSSSLDHLRQILASVGIEDEAASLVNQLSGGQRQRAFLAMVLAQETDIILLDEPINHLDLGFQHSLLQMLADQVSTKNKTVIAALHDLNLAAQYADRIIMMKEGQIVAHDAVSTVFEQSQIESVFGVDGKIVHYPGGRFFAVNQAEQEAGEAASSRTL